MSKFEITSPEGKKFEITAPEGATQDEVLAYAKSQFVNQPKAQSQTAPNENKFGALTNLVGGAVRGAGSIGSTIVAPYDIAKDALAGKGLSLDSNRERRKSIDEGLTNILGTDPESTSYKVGKFGSELAGTLGTGSILAKGAQAVGATPKVVQTLNTWGMNTGATPSGVSAIAKDAALRATAGGITGGAAAGLINPEDVKSGAEIGGGLAAVLPPVMRGG